MDSTQKKSFFYCNVCSYNFDHGTYRYNCIICSDYDQCLECTKTLKPEHPHPLVPELAFGDGEKKVCLGRSMGTTIYTIMEMYCDRHCLGIRYLNSYSWLTYKDVGMRAINFGHGLRTLIEPRQYLGICAHNRPEWIITDWACMFHSIISVPIHTLLSDSDTIFIINNTNISLVVCDREMLPKFIRLQSQCQSLRYIICMDTIPDSMSEKSRLFSTYYMDDIEKSGLCQQYSHVNTKPHDCLTIIYTSGSSGFPKGVMISDSAFRSLFPDDLSPSNGNYIGFAYQPLAWYGGRNNLYATFFRGGRAGFSTGDVSKLMEELALVRPRMFAAPPIIWNKIYLEFRNALSSTNADKEDEQELLEQFSKLIPLRCESIAVVGALISPIVFDFLKRCFRHCRIKDGYGITECGRVAFNSNLDSSVMYRLESVPDLNFTIDDKPFPRGELLIKTAQMFSGYVNNPEETRAVLTDDGFFRTGDIVELHSSLSSELAQIRIIDRKKNFFKLSQGQYVSPEYLQSVFSQSSYVKQIYIYGDLLDECVSAIIVPTIVENKNENLVDVIMSDLRSIGFKESLHKHEIPSRIIIESEPFTVENGLLTSSMKLCRPKLAEKYAAHKLKHPQNNFESSLRAIIENVTGESMANNDDKINFLAFGGNSLTAIRLSRMIHHNLGVKIPLNVLFEPDMNFRRLIELTQTPSSTKEESIVDQLLQDAEFECDKIIGKPQKNVSRPSTVFITGVTGFVGAFLLFEMLQKYPMDCKFICLVRCSSKMDPLDRIRDNFVFLQLWQEEFVQRIVPLRGDLGQIRFGLKQEIYDSLANQIDVIFACGATVNFLLPYSRSYQSNVCGTREIIHFASHTSFCVPIHYISTISVLPPGILDEIHIDQISPTDLTNGYGQSKWVAEKIIAKANRSGLPVAIYRLGSMGSDSRTGACNLHDINTLLVAAIIKMKSYPVEMMNWKLNTLPIDFAAQSIIDLTLSQPGVYGNVYHVIHPADGISFENIITNTYNLGLNLENIPFESWKIKFLQQTIRHHSFEVFNEIFFENIFHRHSFLSSDQFYKIVSRLQIPNRDHAYLAKWLKFIVENILT